MCNVPKIPLSDRLRQADRAGGQGPPHLFRLSARAYCAALDRIFGGSSYRDTLTVLLDLFSEPFEDPPMLTELVGADDGFSDLDRHQFLYQVMVRPYVELQKANETKERSERL